MRPRDKEEEILEAAARIADALHGFDFQVDAEDFAFYELSRLIDEGQASFEAEEFRRLIDEGIRTHVEDRPEIRAALAGKLRAASTMPPSVRAVAMRVVHALENDAADLTNAGALVLAYTAYLFEHLPAVSGEDLAREQECRAAIEHWRAGKTTRDDTAALLKQHGLAAVGPTADLLFGATEDRVAAQTAIEVLAAIRSPVTARVLAHAVSEPLLDEDVESAAFQLLRSSWPLARNYMLHQLRAHSHEDIPILWFQILVQVDEPLAVDLALEEYRAHGHANEFREDLSALADVLESSRDPEMEDKIMAAINDPAAHESVRILLSALLQQHRLPDPDAQPWATRMRSRILNEKYRHAAALFDSGRVTEASAILDDILVQHPRHAFAVMLRALVR
jgi:hypothetical protein